VQTFIFVANDPSRGGALLSSAGSKRRTSFAIVVMDMTSGERAPGMMRGGGCLVLAVIVPSFPLKIPFLTVFSCRGRYSSLWSMFKGGCSTKAGLTRTFFVFSPSIEIPSDPRVCTILTLIPYMILDISGDRSSSNVLPNPARSGSPMLGGSVL
jgi:hypothetical protein